jgi:uncharacterized membrane protein
MRTTMALAIGLAVLAALAALGMGTGFGMMGPAMMWGYGSPVASSGWGLPLAMALGWASMLAFWGAVIAGVILLVRWTASAAEPRDRSKDAKLPLAILRRRYAAGEIDEATYDRMKRELAA